MQAKARPVITLDRVTKVYPLESGDVMALREISLSISEGEFVAIMGPSGSGKSTLLNQIGCLDVPTSGTLTLAGREVGAMNDRELTDLRLTTIGYIFQKFNLIPLLTAYENVEFPLILSQGRDGGPCPGEIANRCRAVLSSVGLDESLATHTPSELSGGQQHRVAIARALVNDPDILLCDEPTGNLDTRTGTTIMELLAEMNRAGKTIIMVTHDQRVAGYARRRIELVDGRLA